MPIVLKTEKLELRGLENCTSKKGNVYYNLYCETMTGKPAKFYCNDASAFPEGLKKGTNVVVTVEYNSFKELSVLKVEMVGA